MFYLELSYDKDCLLYVSQAPKSMCVHQSHQSYPTDPDIDPDCERTDPEDHWVYSVSITKEQTTVNGCLMKLNVYHIV